MKKLLVAVALFAIGLFSSLAYSNPEGPFGCLMGVACSGSAGGSITTTVGLEECLESTVNDYCYLEQGSYNVGATTLTVNIPYGRSKTLYCETGATITGSGDPTIWIWGGGGDAMLWIRGCSFNNTGSSASLRIGGSYGRVWLDNVTGGGAAILAYVHSGTLNQAGDTCATGSIYDADGSFGDVVAGDWVWFEDGTTNMWITARVSSISDSDRRINLTRQLGESPTVCGVGGTVKYRVYHNPYGVIIDVDTGRVYIADSMFNAGLLARTGTSSRSIEIHDVSLSTSGIDVPIVRPCLVVDGGTVQVSNMLPATNAGCTGGYQLDHLSAAGGSAVSIEGGVYSGPFYLGTYLNANQWASLKGITLQTGMGFEGPIVYALALKKLFAEVNVGNVTTTPANWLGVIDGGSATAEIGDVHFDVRVNGNPISTDHLGTNEILGPLLSGGVQPLWGCVTIRDDGNYSSDYRIKDGVVTNARCDLWSSVDTEGTLQGLTKATSNTAATVTVTGRGEIYDNYGATGTVQFDLPAAVKGMSAMFYQRDATDDLEIHPNGADVIYHPAITPPLDAGDCLQQAGGDHTFVSLLAIADGLWSVTSYQGTWDDDGDCG